MALTGSACSLKSWAPSPSSTFVALSAKATSDKPRGAYNPVNLQSMKLDSLVSTAHPDDAELSVGRTRPRLAQPGKKVGVLDVTRGDRGSRVPAESRALECSMARELLGRSVFHNLGVGDGKVSGRPALRGELAGSRETWCIIGVCTLAQGAGGAIEHGSEGIREFLRHPPSDPTVVVDIEPVLEQDLEPIRACISPSSGEPLFYKRPVPVFKPELSP